jgi:hypothetical protein
MQCEPEFGFGIGRALVIVLQLMLHRIDRLNPRTLPALVAVLTAICHLTYGVWFWTKSPTNAPKTGLAAVGEDYLRTFPTWDTEHEADGAFYNRAAMEVLRTGVPRMRTGQFCEHAPLYAYFLAGCYKIGGVRMLSLAVSQALLAALMCYMIGRTAMRLSPIAGVWSGLTAAGLFLCDIRIAGYAGYPSPTLLVLFFFTTSLWAMVRGMDSRLNRFVFFGALICAIYTQAAFFIVAAGIVCWVLFNCWRQRTLRGLVGAAALAIFTLAKPMISLVYDQKHFAPHDASTAVLWEANNPYYESMTAFSLWERRPGNRWSSWTLSETDQKRHDDYLARAKGNNTRAALLWMRENPKDYLELCCVRFRAVFGPYTGQMSPLNKKISTVIWLALFPAGFIGLWRLRKTPFGWMAAFVILFECGFEIAVMAGWQPRYRLPVDMMLYAAAGPVYGSWIQHFFARKSPPATTPQES